MENIRQGRNDAHRQTLTVNERTRRDEFASPKSSVHQSARVPLKEYIWPARVPRPLFRGGLYGGRLFARSCDWTALSANLDRVVRRQTYFRWLVIAPFFQLFPEENLISIAPASSAIPRGASKCLAIKSSQFHPMEPANNAVEMTIHSITVPRIKLREHTIFFEIVVRKHWT